MPFSRHLAKKSGFALSPLIQPPPWTKKSSGVFWKERDAVTAQLHIWDSVRIARLMTRLLDCERALKSSGTAGAVLFRKLMTDIAHQAARARLPVAAKYRSTT